MHADRIAHMKSGPLQLSGIVACCQAARSTSPRSNCCRSPAAPRTTAAAPLESRVVRLRCIAIRRWGSGDQGHDQPVSVPDAMDGIARRGVLWRYKRAGNQAFPLALHPLSAVGPCSYSWLAFSNRSEINKRLSIRNTKPFLSIKKQSQANI